MLFFGERKINFVIVLMTQKVNVIRSWHFKGKFGSLRSVPVLKPESTIYKFNEMNANNSFKNIISGIQFDVE